MGDGYSTRVLVRVSLLPFLFSMLWAVRGGGRWMRREATGRRVGALLDLWRISLSVYVMLEIAGDGGERPLSPGSYCIFFSRVAQRLSRGLPFRGAFSSEKRPIQARPAIMRSLSWVLCGLI